MKNSNNWVPNKIIVCCYSGALGQGWRLGFLGLLHLEVFSQRLNDEYDAQAVITSPSVTYKGKYRSVIDIQFKLFAFFRFINVIELFQNQLNLKTDLNKIFN